jgi:hypothetical protein
MCATEVVSNSLKTAPGNFSHSTYETCLGHCHFPFAQRLVHGKYSLIDVLVHGFLYNILEPARLQGTQAKWGQDL